MTHTKFHENLTRRSSASAIAAVTADRQPPVVGLPASGSVRRLLFRNGLSDSCEIWCPTHTKLGRLTHISTRPTASKSQVDRTSRIATAGQPSQLYPSEIADGRQVATASFTSADSRLKLLSRGPVLPCSITAVEGALGRKSADFQYRFQCRFHTLNTGGTGIAKYRPVYRHIPYRYIPNLNYC